MGKKDTFSIVLLVTCTIMFFVGLIIYLLTNPEQAGPAIIGLSVYGFLLIAISMLLKSLTRLEERIKDLTVTLSQSISKEGE